MVEHFNNGINFTADDDDDDDDDDDNNNNDDDDDDDNDDDGDDSDDRLFSAPQPVIFIWRLESRHSNV